MTAPWLTDEEEERRRLLEQQEQEDEQADAGAAPGGQAPGGGGLTYSPTPAYGGPSGTPLRTSGSLPTGFTPPPPPPPPPPPDLAALTGQLGEFSADWMDTPNPYLSEYATAERAAGEA